MEKLEYYQKLTITEAVMPVVQIEASMNNSSVTITRNVAFTSFPDVRTVFDHKDDLDNAETAADEQVYHLVKCAEGAKVLRSTNSPYDVMTLMQLDNDQIAQLMANWKQKNVHDKMKVIQTFGCYELYIYVKLHDNEFFEKHLREYISDQHIG